MTNHVIIRKAEPSDVDKLYDMGIKENGFVLSTQTRFYTRDYLEKWLQNPQSDILLVAEKDGEIIGFLFCRVFHDSWAMLDNIMVSHSWRRRGIGTALLKECLNKLRMKKVQYIAGIVKEDNESINFFLKNEFLKGNKFIWIEKFL